MTSISLRNCKKFVLSLALLLVVPAFLQAGTLGQSTTYLSNLANPVNNGLFTGANRFTAQPFVTGTDPRG